MEKDILPTIDFLCRRLSCCNDWDTEIEQHMTRLHFTRPRTSWECLVNIAGQIDFEKLFPSFFHDLINHLYISFDPDRALSNLERFYKEIYDKNYLYTILTNNRWLMKTLICLFSGSQYLTDIMIKEPHCFDLLRHPETIGSSKTKDQMYRKLAGMIEGVNRMESLLAVLRKFKRQEFLRIGLRDLLHSADLKETMEDISNVADVCLENTYRFCNSEMIKRFGSPVYTDENGVELKCEFSIIGMGKLGGRELNFSSDIDLMYLYSSDRGKTSGAEMQISNHEFHVKLSTMITKAISEITEDGSVFRVDLGLRPEGSSGDIASSLISYEIYYESWGKTWERQALIKARTVAGNESLGNRFLDMIRPFIYRRYLDISTINEIKSMKDKINKTITHSKARGEDVKLGKGGIREIEFIIQIFQLIYGGRDEIIRERNSLNALQIIYNRGYINKEDYETLVDAYRFLRNLEHRIQMSFGLQTHRIPDSIEEKGVLARKMGRWKGNINELAGYLIKEYRLYTGMAQKIYDSILSKKILPDERDIKGPGEEKEIFFDDNDELIISNDFLDKYEFSDKDRTISNLSLMYRGHSFSHPSQKSKEYFNALTPRIIHYSQLTPDPDRAINNMERFVYSSGARDNLFSMLLENKNVLKLLISLFGNSDFLSNSLITRPDLIDTLLDVEGINRFKAKEKMREELLQIIAAAGDNEELLDGIRKFKKGEELRIGIRYIIGEADLNGTFEDLSGLAEVCLDAALHISEKHLKGKYGVPYCNKNEKKAESRLSIIGMGKLGGYELDFGSDIDLIFIYSDDGTTSGSGSDKESIIDNQFYFTKVCESIFHIITEVRNSGYVYRIDPQLRPEGKKGVLTVSIGSFEKYLMERGQTWEKQALIKARPVAGDPETGELFIKRVYDIVYKGPFKLSTLLEMRSMRRRIEEELGQEKKGRKDVKFGYGGLVDIEFITQLLQMKYGVTDTSLRTTSTLTALDDMQKKGIISPEDSSQLKDSYRFYRKIILGLRIENQISRNTLPASLNKLARRIKYSDSKKITAAEKFMKDYTEHTDRVRTIYKKIFGIKRT